MVHHQAQVLEALLEKTVVILLLREASFVLESQAGGVPASEAQAIEARSCGDITISGESTVITFTKGLHAPWGIGNGEGGTCGTVTIGDGATVNDVKYTETHTGTL